MTKLATGSIACSNAVFGDPAPYVVKSCSFANTSVAPVVTWTICSVENGSCSFSGTRDVRYGAGTNFSTRTATGSIACSNAVFGDPIFGVAKSCAYSSVTK